MRYDILFVLLIVLIWVMVTGLALYWVGEQLSLLNSFLS